VRLSTGSEMKKYIFKGMNNETNKNVCGIGNACFRVSKRMFGC
ncbi:hypothetical protein THOM_1426, partial [Trachipleistophora hominis]